MNLCPCHSGLPYSSCCQPYHLGTSSPNALALMRSRYAAYALGLSDYIIQTTDPKNPGHQTNITKWKKELDTFTYHTTFMGLEIIDFEESNEKATVTFHAILKQNGNDTSFTEKSLFFKKNNRWLYSGVIPK